MKTPSIHHLELLVRIHLDEPRPPANRSAVNPVLFADLLEAGLINTETGKVNDHGIAAMNEALACMFGRAAIAKATGGAT